MTYTKRLVAHAPSRHPTGSQRRAVQRGGGREWRPGPSQCRSIRGGRRLSGGDGGRERHAGAVGGGVSAGGRGR